MELAQALLHVATDQLTRFEGPDGGQTTAVDAIRIVREHNKVKIIDYEPGVASEHIDAYQTVVAATDEAINEAITDYGLDQFCRRAAQAAAVRLGLDIDNDQSEDPWALAPTIDRFDQNVEHVAHILERTDNFSAYEALQVARKQVEGSIAKARQLTDDTNTQDTDMNDQHTRLDKIALFRLWTGKADDAERRYRDASIGEYNRAQERIVAWRDSAAKVHTAPTDITTYLAERIDTVISAESKNVYAEMLNDVHELSSGTGTFITTTRSGQQPRPIYETEVTQAAVRWGLVAELPGDVRRLQQVLDADLSPDTDERTTIMSAIEDDLKDAAVHLVAEPTSYTRIISGLEIDLEHKVITQCERIAELAGKIQDAAAAVAADMKASYTDTDGQESDQ